MTYLWVVKKRGYINIWHYKDGKRRAEGIFSTREEAENHQKTTGLYEKVYIKTIEIEWEE